MDWEVRAARVDLNHAHAGSLDARTPFAAQLGTVDCRSSAKPLVPYSNTRYAACMDPPAEEHSPHNAARLPVPQAADSGAGDGSGRAAPR